MNVGTKSVLFGGHAFFLHPIFTAWGWWKLYGFPFDPKLWISFIIHDLGYFGKINMDGVEGEIHVEFAANIMGSLFGKKWKNFCLYHSRFYAKKNNRPFSRLCVADKMAFILIPDWLYLFSVTLSGEIYEYMKLTESKYATMNISVKSKKEWRASVKKYLSKWIEIHKEGRNDSWIPEE